MTNSSLSYCLAVSELLKNVHDDILFEIFLRLPNGRSAVQYSSVCKHWFSIIYSSRFMRNFVHIHDHLCPRFSKDYYCSRTFTLLFARHDRLFRNGPFGGDPHYFEPFCQVFSEKSNNKVPHGKIHSSYFSFLPNPVAILASFDDLVVVTSLLHTYWQVPALFHAEFIGPTKNYICNPLTKQWLSLPHVIPPLNIAGYGFIREPITTCNEQNRCTANAAARYRVVMIGRAYFDRNNNVRHCVDNAFVTKVFCSESGEWSESVILYPRRTQMMTIPVIDHIPITRVKHDIVVFASNGILYWLEGNPIKGIVAFDPFNDIYTKRCRLVPLPLLCFQNNYWYTDRKVCLGVVNGQLRLSQLYNTQPYYFALKVWELKDHESELKDHESESPLWILVYNFKFESMVERHVYMLSFHPNNTNIIFLLCGDRAIYKYKISEKKYEEVGEYPEIVNDPWIDISAFTLLHPSWPSMLPLPST